MEILILNTMAEDALSELPCKVYPNPAINQLFFEFENPGQEVYSLTIYNNQGKKLYQFQPVTGEQVQIDVSGYEPGIYLFDLKREGDEAKYRGKFMVQ
jgi:hypothetical protein